MWRPYLIFIVFNASLAVAAETAPGWVLEQSTRAIPKYAGEVATVTLLDDAHSTVELNGVMHRQSRYAIRILNEEGRRDAVAEVTYFQKATKIREMKAWLVTPDGAVKAYAQGSASDIALQARYELYDDVRARVIHAQNPPLGSTFAWEANVDEPVLMALDSWSFQH